MAATSAPTHHSEVVRCRAVKVLSCQGVTYMTSHASFHTTPINLYQLHAANIALLPDPAPSQPLPRIASHYSRRILLHLKAQADAAITSLSSSVSPLPSTTTPYRTPLWYTDHQQRSVEASLQRGTERDHLVQALHCLPDNWKLQNAFCLRCAAMIIPGITASSLLIDPGKDEKQRHDLRRVRSNGGSRRESGPPLVCLLCLTPSTHRDTPSGSAGRVLRREVLTPSTRSGKLKRYLPLTMQEERTKKASLVNYPAVRNHQRTHKGLLRSAVQAVPRVRKERKRTLESADVPSRTSHHLTIEAVSTVRPCRATSPPNTTSDHGCHSSTPLFKDEKSTQPSSSSSSSSSSPIVTTPKTQPQTSGPSLLLSCVSSPSRQQRYTKEDHKSALRAMLAKGDDQGRRRKKIETQLQSQSQSQMEGKGKGGANAGWPSPSTSSSVPSPASGLRDFLAGL